MLTSRSVIKMSTKGQSSPVNSVEPSGLDNAESADDQPATAEAGGNAFKKPQSPKTAKAKGTRSVREPHQIGTVSSQEEMEPKVLLFQNKKLAERLDHYRVTTEELRNRNEQLQQRLSATDSEIFIINRHMKSLDENVRMLLRRFEINREDLTEDTENPRSPLESLLLQLSTLDEEELDKTLSGRVQETRNLIGKLVQVYETVWNQSRTVLEKLKNGEDVDESRKAAIDQVLRKNDVLESQALSTQVKCDSALSETSKLKDRVTELETERDELKNREADLSWSLDKEQTRREKAENLVVELRQKVTAMENQLGTKRKQGSAAGVSAPVTNVSQTKMGEMVTDLEDQKSLAANRLEEIKKLHDEKAALVLELDEIKVKVQSAPDDVVMNSHLYKSLQVDYSVLCTQHEKLKEYYQVAKDAVGTLRATYLQQLKEAQRHEEDGSQLLQEYLSNLQTVTNAARTHYQRLKIEFEQERACRETSGTSKDYDKLFKSVMEHNHSMQREVERLRKKNLSLQSDLAKCQPLGRNVSKTGSGSPEKRTFDGEHKARDPGSVERTTLRQSGNNDYMGSPDTHGESSGLKELKKQLKDKTKEYDELKLLYDMTKQASKINRELVEISASERRLKDENAELRRTAASAEERIAAAESGHRTASDIADALKIRNKGLEDRVQELERDREKEKSERQRGGPDEEMHKRIRVLEESLTQCKKALQNRKEEEDAMMNEMEITGQALEDLQNQNKQLIDQLKEKDGTNLKWMSDSIRNNQIIRTLKDEKGAQESRFRIASDTMNKYEKQLILADERIRCIEEANAVLEEDRKSADYLVDSWKRKAFEQTKEANDLHLKLDQLEKEFKFARTVHADKLKSYEGDVYKARRLMEENAELKRKLERVKLIEVTGSSEEILREDLREYKELLNCPSCKSARKDTVLTKCFHVFCNSCISKRYESRQRRCPQCSTPFGANDYRRLFLG